MRWQTVRNGIGGLAMAGLVSLGAGSVSLAQGTSTAGDRGTGAPTTGQRPSEEVDPVVPLQPRTQTGAVRPADPGVVDSRDLVTAHALEMAIEGAELLGSARLHTARVPGDPAAESLRRRAEQAFMESDRLFAAAADPSGVAEANSFHAAAQQYARTVRGFASAVPAPGNTDPAIRERGVDREASALDGAVEPAPATGTAEMSLVNQAVGDIVKAHSLRQAIATMPVGPGSDALLAHAQTMDARGREALGITGATATAAATSPGATNSPATPMATDPSLFRVESQAGVDRQGNAGAGVETTGPGAEASVAATRPEVAESSLVLLGRQVVQALDSLGTGVEAGGAGIERPGAVSPTAPAPREPGSEIETDFGRGGSLLPETTAPEPEPVSPDNQPAIDDAEDGIDRPLPNTPQEVQPAPATSPSGTP